MIKILYVLNSAFYKGGIETVVLNYYRYINGTDIKIDFALHCTQKEYDENQVIKKLICNGTQIYRVTPRYISIRKNHHDLKNIFLLNYDIVHTHTDAIGADILKVAKKCGIKYRIAHSHNTDFAMRTKGIKRFLKLIYLAYCRFDIRREANYYMACSHSAGKWLFGKNNSSKVYILHNAIEVEKYSFSENKRNKFRRQLHLENDIVLGTVGRLNYQKNHVFLINILKQLLLTSNRYKLLIVGEGELEEQLKILAKKYGILDNIIFYGTTDIVPDLYNVMDIFMLPSLYEGLPLVLVEAQANGLKCLVTDSDKVTKETDLTGQITWLPLDKPERWVNTIQNMSCRRCVGSEKKIAKKGYDLKVEAQKLAEYYRTIINNE